MSFANFFDFGFFGTSEVFEALKEGFRFAGGEGFADEWREVFAVADGGGEEELVLLVGVDGEGVVVVAVAAATLGGLHEEW